MRGGNQSAGLWGELLTPDGVPAVALKRDHGKGLLDRPDSSNVGRGQLVTPGSSATLLELACDDDTGRVVTVTLLLQPGPQGIQAGDDPIAVAHVTWGIGGISADAEVDFGTGVQLNVPATFLRVTATHEGVAGAGNTGAIMLGAFVGYFPIGVCGCATRTLRRLVPLVPPADQDFPVPNFARSVQLVRTPAAGVSFNAQFVRADGTIAYTVAVGGGAQMADVAIANDIRTVRYDTVVGTPAQIRAIFTLGI
jgi:hypothetical protein